LLHIKIPDLFELMHSLSEKFQTVEHNPKSRNPSSFSLAL